MNLIIVQLKLDMRAACEAFFHKFNQLSTMGSIVLSLVNSESVLIILSNHGKPLDMNLKTPPKCSIIL